MLKSFLDVVGSQDKMTELYIVRHCEAVGNVEKFFQGVIDTDITECGRLQLEKLAERFKNIHIDKIYSSPLKRAVKTAEAINKYHNLPINIHNKLIEIGGGEIEGVYWGDFDKTRPELEYNWNMRPHLFHPKDGESMESVYKRSWEAVLEIVSANKGKKVAVASHGCTIRNIMCHALGKPIEELCTVKWADNTGVFHLIFKDEELPEIVMYNDTSHLTPELMPGGSKIRTVVYDKKPCE